MQSQHEEDLREAESNAKDERTRMFEELTALRLDIARLAERLPRGAGDTGSRQVSVD